MHGTHTLGGGDVHRAGDERQAVVHAHLQIDHPENRTSIHMETMNHQRRAEPAISEASWTNHSGGEKRAAGHSPKCGDGQVIREVSGT